MQLFAGLGNPGSKHARQRHNIGFMVVDAIAARHGFPPFRAKFQAEISDGRIGTERITLMKPQTFMNRSGQSIGEAMRYLKLAPSNLTVFHDELDLAPGKLRLKTGGGHAGHNGLRSIHAHIGEGYHRVRLGIGHPGAKELVSGYVLHDFTKADADWLNPLLDAVAEAAPRLAEGDHAGFQNAVALACRPASTTGQTASVAPTAPAPPPQELEESALQRLVRHFSRGR